MGQSAQCACCANDEEVEDALTQSLKQSIINQSITTAPNVLKEDSTCIVHDNEAQTENESDIENHDAPINIMDDVIIINQTKQTHSPANQDVFAVSNTSYDSNVVFHQTPNDNTVNIPTEFENSENLFACRPDFNQTTAHKVLDTSTSNTALTANTYDSNHMIQSSLDKHESSGTDHHHNERKQLLIHARSSDNINNYHEVGRLDGKRWPHDGSNGDQKMITSPKVKKVLKPDTSWMDHTLDAPSHIHAQHSSVVKLDLSNLVTDAKIFDTLSPDAHNGLERIVSARLLKQRSRKLSQVSEGD